MLRKPLHSNSFFQSTTLQLPSIQSWGACCFLQVARTAAQHCMERKWLNVRKALYGIMSVLILSAIEHFCLQTSDKPCLGEGGWGLGGGGRAKNPRAGTIHEELIWTFFSFFCNFLFVNVENPQISPQKIILNEALHIVDLVVEGGFLIKKNYRHHYLSSQWQSLWNLKRKKKGRSKP